MKLTINTALCVTLVHLLSTFDFPNPLRSDHNAMLEALRLDEPPLVPLLVNIWVVLDVVRGGSGGGCTVGGKVLAYLTVGYAVRYGQRLRHTNSYDSLGGSFQCLDSLIQWRILQSSVIDKEQAIAWDETAINLSNATWHEAPDNYHCFIWVHRVLKTPTSMRKLHHTCSPKLKTIVIGDKEQIRSTEEGQSNLLSVEMYKAQTGECSTEGRTWEICIADALLAPLYTFLHSNV